MWGKCDRPKPPIVAPLQLNLAPAVPALAPAPYAKEIPIVNTNKETPVLAAAAPVALHPERGVDNQQH